MTKAFDRSIEGDASTADLYEAMQNFASTAFGRNREKSLLPGTEIGSGANPKATLPDLTIVAGTKTADKGTADFRQKPTTAKNSMEPVDAVQAKNYLKSDRNSLPQVAIDFKELGMRDLKNESDANQKKLQLHVSTRAGDKSFPLGSKENPFTSIQSAVHQAPDGSVINVHRSGSDIYKERVNISRSNLVIQTDAANPAIIDLAGKTSGRANAAFSVTSGSSNLTIKNFDIRHFGQYSAAIRIDGANIHNITVAGNEIHSASGAEAIAIYGRGATEATKLSNINVISNKVHDLKLGELEAIPINGNVSGFKVMGNSGYRLDNIFIDTIGGEGTSKNKSTDQARRGTISFNYADGVSTLENPASSLNGQYSAAAIYSDGGRDLTITNNYLRHSDFGIEVGGEHSGLSSSNVAVSGNVVESSNFVWLGRGGDPERPGGARDSFATNNVVIGNSRAELQANVQNFVVKNNPHFADLSSVKLLPSAIADAMRKHSGGQISHQIDNATVGGA